jgi:hypothetical protein
MNAKELLAFAGKAAVRIFEETGSIMPVLHMVDEHNAHILLHWATGFENHNAKQFTSEMMRKALQEAHAERYALVLEAWTVDECGDHKLAMDMSSKGISLEGHPDRIEVITIFVEDKRTKESLSRMYRILRPEHGKATLAPPRNVETVRGEGPTGRFDNLFDEKEQQK